MNGILKRTGYRLVADNQLEHAAFARHLQRLLEAIDVQCVLDVGAHVGEYRNFLRNEIGYTGWIVSFEPVRTSVATLKELAKTDDRWIVCGFALGSENRTKQINVMRFDGLSSFLNPNNHETEQFRELNVIDHTETVEVRTLHSAMESLTRSHPSAFTSIKDSFEPNEGRQNIFLKMDTQGFDLEVIKGAGDAISRIAGLQTELSILPIYEGIPVYQHALGELEHMGYDISGIYPIVRDSLLRVVEFDCVMVRRDRLC